MILLIGLTGWASNEVIESCVGIRYLGKGLGEWLVTMRQGDAEERARAVIALDTVGLGDRRAKAALEAALKDPAPVVRVQAASALWARSPQRRREVLAILGEVFSDERGPQSQADPRCQWLAVDTLRRIGWEARPYLAAAVERGSEGAAQAARDALASENLAERGCSRARCLKGAWEE